MEEVQEGEEYHMVRGIEFPRKLLNAYELLCKPLCKELKLPQTAFDILMFLGNNPEYKTARDIVEVRNIKANLVSVNVDRLVQEGYLVRQAVEGDRRKTHLICTDKAKKVIRKGKKLQKDFAERLFQNMDPQMQEVFWEIMKTMEENAEEILKEEK